MFAPVIGAAYTMTTKREAHWSEQTKAQNTEKGMYVGLKQPRGEGERYVTPARAVAKETILSPKSVNLQPMLDSRQRNLTVDPRRYRFQLGLMEYTERDKNDFLAWLNKRNLVTGNVAKLR